MNCKIISVLAMFVVLLTGCIVEDESEPCCPCQEDAPPIAEQEEFSRYDSWTCDEFISQDKRTLEVLKNSPLIRTTPKLKVRRMGWVNSTNCAHFITFRRGREEVVTREAIEKCLIEYGGNIEEIGRSGEDALVLYTRDEDVDHEYNRDHCLDGAMFFVPTAEIDEQEVLDSEWLKTTNTKVWDLLRGYSAELARDVRVPYLRSVNSENLMRTKDSCYIEMGNTVKEVDRSNGRVLLRYKDNAGFPGELYCHAGTLFFLPEKEFTFWEGTIWPSALKE